MPKFKIGDRVRVPSSCYGLFPVFHGKTGTIQDEYSYPSVLFDSGERVRGSENYLELVEEA